MPADALRHVGDPGFEPVGIGRPLRRWQLGDEGHHHLAAQRLTRFGLLVLAPDRGREGHRIERIVTQQTKRFVVIRQQVRRPSRSARLS